jgi:hypothetical protein
VPGAFVMWKQCTRTVIVRRLENADKGVIGNGGERTTAPGERPWEFNVVLTVVLQIV